MTRDGAVAENLTTGETSSISERPQEENYSAPAAVSYTHLDVYKRQVYLYHAGGVRAHD